jgi:hypothetical protein
MSEIRVTRRKSQEEAFARLSDCLRALTDDQLEELRRRFSHIEGLSSATDEGPFMAAWEHPVTKAHYALHDLLFEEGGHRSATLVAVEADLNGGHLVEVVAGDDTSKYRADCDPRPFDGEPVCWTGPDRETIAEALEDGRRHHPGSEPRLRPVLLDGGES